MEETLVEQIMRCLKEMVKDGEVEMFQREDGEVLFKLKDEEIEIAYEKTEK